MVSLTWFNTFYITQCSIYVDLNDFSHKEYSRHRDSESRALKHWFIPWLAIMNCINYTVYNIIDYIWYIAYDECWNCTRLLERTWKVRLAFSYILPWFADVACFCRIQPVLLLLSTHVGLGWRPWSRHRFGRRLWPWWQRCRWVGWRQREMQSAGCCNEEKSCLTALRRFTRATHAINYLLGLSWFNLFRIFLSASVS